MTHAIAIASEIGLEGLNTRVLGERMGVHSTAVYRHFRTWDDLLMQVYDAQFGVFLETAAPTLDAAPGPRERLLVLMRSIRAAVDADPHLVDGLIGIARSPAAVPTPNIDAATAIVVDALVELGLTGRSLAVAHHALEDFMLGSSVVDYAGFPQHVENRRRRRRMIGLAELAESSATDDEVRTVTELGFEFTAQSLLDACERLAHER